MNIRILVTILAMVPAIALAQDKPTFTPGATSGEFRFDTGAIAGVFREGGVSIGLVPAELKGGEALAKTPGLLNYYRIFTTNKRLGESMRTVPSVATVVDAKTIRARWEPTEELPFALTATYSWSAPDTLDVETVVEAKADLPEFEVFLSSYMTDAFPVVQVYARRPGEKDRFMTADPGAGQWQMFPRDADAVRLIKDGRWTFPPSPVDWAIRPDYAAPLLYRRHADSKLAVVQMSRPENCYAVSMPCNNEPHNSMYFSLFGKTLAPGDTVRAHTRMIVAALDENEMVARYEAFLRETEGDR